MNLERILEEGIKDLGITCTPLQTQQWLEYVLLLEKWNHAFNLTAVKSPAEMIRRHILESLTLSPYLVGDGILDVGTGAGLPGIPLAILHPEKHFFMLDSNHKKQVFVRTAIGKLNLIHANAVHSLVEKYQPAQKFSTIVSRAFAPLPKALPLISPLLAKGGKLLLMLGKCEALTIEKEYYMESLITLKIPGETAQRHLAIISQSEDLSEGKEII